jgi:hypothetical protein
MSSETEIAVTFLIPQETFYMKWPYLLGDAAERRKQHEVYQKIVGYKEHDLKTIRDRVRREPGVRTERGYTRPMDFAEDVCRMLDNAILANAREGTLGADIVQGICGMANCLRTVSFLCTVTFYANIAHSLTRSPEHL